MRAIIDCDVLVYQSAFGAQKTRYNVLYNGDTKTFENAKDRDAWLKENNLTKEDVEIESWLDVLDEHIACSIAKKNLQYILDELRTIDYILYLTGKENFRNEVAVTKPYKGNRQQEKPVHFEAVKNWYISRGAKTVSGFEADDMLGIKATQEPNKNVMCTVDKDLNMVQGLHYNWSEGIKYKVSKFDGDRFFLSQLIAGDPTDNITGIPKYGLKKAKEFITGYKTNTEAFNAVWELYQEKGFDINYFEEMGRLVWIKRKLDEPLWNKEWFNEYLKGE